MFLLVFLVVFFIGAYFVFRKTMNVFQRLGKIYWVTRDNASGPLVRKAWMRFTGPPFWRGEGIEFRFRSHSFQIGILKTKMPSLENQLSNLPEYSVSVQEIRKWGQDESS
jgi:hypothetical protein